MTSELVVQTGHASSLTSLAVSADGALAVTGSEDGTAIMWDVVSGKQLRRFASGAQQVSAAAVPRDGRLLVSAAGNVATAWDAATGKVKQRFQSPGGEVTAVAISADSKLIAVGLSVTSTFIYPFVYGITWDAVTGREVARYKGSHGSAAAVAFSPDGRTVLSGMLDNTAVLWDALTGEEKRELTGHTGFVRAVAFSADGSSVATRSDDRTARVWSTATGKVVTKLTEHQGDISAVAFSPGGRYLVSGSYDGTTRLWLTETGAEICRLVTFKDGGWTAVAPDGRFDTHSLEQVPRLYDEASRGQRGVLENGEVVNRQRRAELFGAGNPAVTAQQPLLFDFVRGRWGRCWPTPCSSRCPLAAGPPRNRRQFGLGDLYGGRAAVTYAAHRAFRQTGCKAPLLN